MTECATDEAHRLTTASIGLAIPNDSEHYGYLSEHHSFGQKEKEAGQYAQALAAYMLATTLGENFDTSQIWVEGKSVYKISDRITVRTRNITQTIKGEKGLWATAIAAAIFVP